MLPFTVVDFSKLFPGPMATKRLEGLLRKADVIVEGFRPGLMRRLGLGWAEVRRINPRIVYCSVTGYPEGGPWAAKAGHDLNFQATSGLLSLGAPGPLCAVPADLAGSTAAVEAILAALLERERTGRGKKICVSIAEAFHRQLAIPLSGPEWFPANHPFYRLYETSDGRQVAVAALEPQFQDALRRSVGDDLGAAFRARPLAHWREVLGKVDGCACPVLTVAEARAFFAQRATGASVSRAPKPNRRPSVRPAP